MKKIILFFALLLSVGSVNAATKKMYATLAAENASYTDHTFTWTAAPSDGGGQRLKLFSGLKGNVDLSVYKWLNITISNKTAERGWRFVIMCNDNANTAAYTSETMKTTLSVRVDLTTLTLNDGSDEVLSSVNGIYLQGQWGAGSFDVVATDVYLETDESAVSTNTTDFSSLTTGGTWSSSLPTLPVAVSPSLQLIGADSGVTNYAVISGYHAIIFQITDFTTQGGGAIRAFVCDDDDASYTTVWAYPVGTTPSSWTTQPAKYDGNTANNGYYYVDLTGYTRLVGIKINSYQTATVYNIAKVYLVKNGVSITDGVYACEMVDDPVGTSVAYNRTFTVGQKSTVCLPFALTADEVTTAGTFYKLTSAADGVLHFTEQSTTEAYVPYVFVPAVANPFASLTGKAIKATPAAESGYATTIDGYTFQGTMEHQTLASGVFGYNSSTGVFSKTTTDAVTIDAFRAYIKSTSSAHSIDCIFEEGGTTGISEVKSMTEVNNGKYYNLNGQEVENPTKGLYIVNGKKVILK